MNPADLLFLGFSFLRTLVSTPLALLLVLVLVLIACRVLGIGSGGKRGLRALFDVIETDARALGTFLGFLFLSIAVLVAALVR